MAKNDNIIDSIRRLPSRMRASKQGIINEELSNFLASSFTLCIQPLWNDTDVFNQTERRGMLSSSWLLNMKRLVILKQQRKKTSITWEK